MNGEPRGITTSAAVVAAVAFLVGAGRARAADAGAETLVDRREIIVPAKGAEVLRIDNLLGRITVRGVARPGEIHIVAEKRASTPDALGRLRVHYTAFENGEVVVDTRVELGGRERSLPLAGSGVDLVVDVPPDSRGGGEDLRRRRVGLRAARRREAGDDRGPDRRLGRPGRRGHPAAARRPDAWRRSRATSTSTASRGTWTCATWGAVGSTPTSSTAASAPRTCARGWCVW